MTDSCKRKHRFSRTFLALSLLSCLLWAGGCGGKKQAPNEEIFNLLVEGKQFDESGDHLAAMEHYRGLLPFLKNKELMEQMQVESILEERGWSIKGLEKSCTLKLIHDLQNRVNQFARKNGRFPDMEQKEWQVTDPWGNLIVFSDYVKLKNKGKYDFSLNSRGPDGVKDTMDEIRIFNKVVNVMKKKDSPAPPVPKKNNPNSGIDLGALVEMKKKELSQEKEASHG